MGFLDRIGITSRSRLLGVDIGTNSIKLCVLKQLKDGFVMEQLIETSYRDEILSDGYIIDPFYVGAELKRLVTENHVRVTNAAAAISSYSVISKYISLPALSEEEFEESAMAEIERVIPLPASEIYYSFSPVGFSQEREDLIDVFVVAVKRGIVDDYRKAFKLAGLNLEILDVDILAISNLVEEIYGPLDTAVMVMDIGSTVTNLAIVKDGRIQFSREILFGGNMLTRSIAKIMNISYEEAEDRKKRGDPEVSHLLEDFVFNVLSEVRKTINFYLSAKPNESLRTIYVTGGSALVQGLTEKISEETGVATELVDPFRLLLQNENLDRYAQLRYRSALAISLSSRIRELRGRNR